jgi:general secretion pathway protein M
MKQYWLRMNEWLAQLQPRERVMVLAGAVVVAITLLYAAIWQPLVKAHLRREQALAEARVQASRLEVASAELQRNRGRAGADTSTSILSAVDKASRSPTLGKTPTRMQPEGERNVNVWLDDVAFDNLARWLVELETRFGIVPVAADVQRQSGVGPVNAHLTLARP